MFINCKLVLDNMSIIEARKALQPLLERFYQYKNDKTVTGNEDQVGQSFIKPFIRDVLHWEIEKPSQFRVEYPQNGKRMDYLVRNEGISQFVVEAKKITRDIFNDEEAYKQVIRYAHDKEKDFAIVTNFKQFVILRCDREVSPLQAEIAKFELESASDEDLQLILFFERGYWLSRGKNNELYSKLAHYKKRDPIDVELVENMSKWRSILSSSIRKNSQPSQFDFDDEQEKMEAEGEIQKLINRLIFVCYCEDKDFQDREIKSILNDKKERFWDKKGFLLNKINELFARYNSDYNSDLFERSDCDKFIIDDDKLMIVLEDLRDPKGKLPPDFEAIEVDILGKAYEQFIGHVQTGEKRIKEKEDISKRKKEGIYYTPKYIVDYIVNNTVREYIKGMSFEQINKVKILDPACGSGSFLLRAFDVLVEESEARLGRKLEYNEKKNLMLNSIHGVDLDKRAVSIAKLNLSLKMAVRGEKLPMLNETILHGNSLIDDKKVAGWDAFVWEEHFKEIMQKGGFDVVVGNPPWGADLNEKEKEFLTSKYKEVPSKTKDTYFYFIIKALELLRKEGYFGFIVPNTWLLINNTEDFRKMLLNYNIKEIIDLGDGVFEDATVESSIIISQKENSKNKSCKAMRFKKGVKLFEHLIPLNVWLNQPYCKIIIDLDSKTNAFMEGLKKNSKLFSEYADIIWGIKPYQIGHGTPPQTKEVLEKRIYHSSHQKGKEWKPLLVGKDVDKYQLKFPNNQYIKYGKWLMYPSNEKFMLEPKIIIRQTSDKIRACYDELSFYCQNSLFIVHSDRINLKFLLALLNSQLFDYLYYLSNPQKGKVFAEIKPSAIKNLPIKIGTEKEQKVLIKIVDCMLFLHQELNNTKDQSRKAKIEAEIKKTDREIDELVYQLYGITEEEKKIIEEGLK